MPQDETVSEAEVEAARAALRDQFDIWVASISMRAALTAAAQVRERAAYEREEREYAGLMPIYGATEDPSAAELAVGQIVTVVTVTDDGAKTERVPWSEIMNPPTGERAMSEKPDLETRVRQFERMELPGQMRAMHMGTAYLVNDLWREVQRLQALVEAPLFSGPVTEPEPDSGPDVLGEQKGD